MRISANHWIIFIAALSVAAGCEQDLGASSRLADQKSSISIKSVELIEQDLSPTTSPSKRLEEWKVPDDPKLSRLPVFDVVVGLQNTSNSSAQDADFIALTTIEFVVAPTYLYQGDVRKILQSGNWGRLTSVKDVKMQTVPYIKSGESVELRLKGFNLGDLLARYNGQDDNLWPWGMKVNVHIVNREMTRVAFGQATLSLFPADSRLRAK